jgi:uncharacterized membrane protein (DUF2068 family)
MARTLPVVDWSRLADDRLEETSMDRERRSRYFGVRLIGAWKLATALLASAAGIGIFRLVRADVAARFEHLATRLHLDPENRLIHALLVRLGRLSRADLQLLGAGTFFYALLHAVEGTGLVLRRRWAEYLTIGATASLLVPEIYEIACRVSLLRVVVLLGNLGILGYLVYKVRQQIEEQVRNRRE